MEIVIGISACLNGHLVRFDGGHKRSAFVSDTLPSFVRLRPFCPEMAAGFGSPRPSMRLQGDATAPRVFLKSNGGEDITERMHATCARLAPDAADLCGFVLCANSPTCGMERVRVYDASNVPAKTGVGVFAKRLMQDYPWLPLEEDGRLNDPHLRENFMMRVYALAYWRELMAAGVSGRALVQFHSRYKLILMAHAPLLYRELGRFVANPQGRDWNELGQHYLHAFMQGTRKIATRGRHANVLAHIQGYFRRHLESEDRQELAAVIQDYRCGRVPLLAPLALLRHYLRRFPDPYLQQQAYFEPYPADLRLRHSL